MELVAQTDWLASRPLFVDLETNRWSENLADLMLERTHIDFDHAGLSDYLLYGYSVFERTPIKSVRMLPPSTSVLRNPSGGIHIASGDDPYDSVENVRLSEMDLIDLIETRVQALLAEVPGEVVIPLSGGMDSRLLAWCARKERDRLRAFTFGTSPNPARSHEVTVAHEIAHRLGIRWQHIPLKDIHTHFEAWYDLFGPSTHAHGMYQIEFYRRVSDLAPEAQGVLSGLIGDAWAGSINKVHIAKPMDLRQLGYTHGLHADPKRLLSPPDHSAMDRFYSLNRHKLEDPKFQVVATMRIKMALLSYLVRVPESLNYAVKCPFLDPTIALGMLNLPLDRRRGRQWQRDFFARVDLDVTPRWWSDSRNVVDYSAMFQDPLQPLGSCLTDLVDPAYVGEINEGISVSRHQLKWLEIRDNSTVRRVTSRLRLPDRARIAYNAYRTLWPLQRALVGHNRRS